MRAILLTIFLWQAAVAPWAQTADQRYLRYERSIRVPSAGQSCAVIDAGVFAHAGASLKDLRLYQGAYEIPYVITLSSSVQTDSDSARVLNAGMRGGSIVSDLEMPARPYTEVALDLAGHDYIATATVSGSNSAHGGAATNLGEFTLFDLTSQHLSHNTTMHLQESNFPYLHVMLTVSAAPGAGTFKTTPRMILGATVPPSREGQTLYATAAETTNVTRHGRQSIATFVLPVRIPVERIAFDIAPDFKGNFSRDIHMYDRPQGTPATSGEHVSGTIFRVHLNEKGREIRQEQLSIPATIGSNLQSAATVEVAIDNGDDAPLPITAVRLEMRQRKLCFNAPSAQLLALFYGDPGLAAPQYDYARLFSPASGINAAQSGPEQENPEYRERPDTRPLTERHPDLLWIALLASICSLGVVAFRSSRTLPR